MKNSQESDSRRSRPPETGLSSFRAINPLTSEPIGPHFFESTADEINRLVKNADDAFQVYRRKSGFEKADFLETIADQILELGDELIECCSAETGLPQARLTGERGRTINQLKLFATLVREGSWVDARIDRANADRQPVPKPDVRSMEKPIGPVAVFGASNFPLAFSAAGGDTASALAAGCTVVVKAHPAHPGTCQLVAAAIHKAQSKCGLPEGVFSMIHGRSVGVGMTLVKHPLIKAVGFTGSLRGGKALFDAASARDEPIPVYAEMGSVNPVFILPDALGRRCDEIAAGLAGSVNLGIGQFCTNPGVFIVQNSPYAERFELKLADRIKDSSPGVMLTDEIRSAYEHGITSLRSHPGVELLATGAGEKGGNAVTATLLKTRAADFLADEELENEVFGPSTLEVLADDKNEMLKIATNLRGHLTASIFATNADLESYGDLIAILEQKVGRLILNDYPTGVEVCHSMIHGGPFPATTDRRTTSVGTRAITRFTAAMCYQNFTEALLPDELKEQNPLGIWRLVDGNREI